MGHALLLFGAGLLAGAMNAMAGGGSFMTLPALMAAGVPSMTANASRRALPGWTSKRLGLPRRPRRGRTRPPASGVPGYRVEIRRRERKQQKFKAQGSAQRFLSTHSVVYNTFNTQPHLIRRPALRLFRAQAHRT
jgi:putative transposase